MGKCEGGSGQKEIRIPTTEAENLVHHLSLLNLRVIENYQEKTVEEVVTSVTMDGGGFWRIYDKYYIGEM